MTYRSPGLGVLVVGLGLSAALSTGLALAGCSSDDGTASTPDAGTEDGGTTTPTEAGADAGPQRTVNSCRTYLDRTAETASRSLLWDFAIATAEERCIRVKAGQSVIFGDGASGPADFATHPLVAEGGDEPNPIGRYDEATGKVTFAEAGTFGYACGNHPAMTGAILVVP